MDRVIVAVKLTKREQDVVVLLAEGKSITETSVKLKIAVFTVKSHVRNVLDKLALHTRLELATFGLSNGLTKKASVGTRKGRD